MTTWWKWQVPEGEQVEARRKVLHDDPLEVRVHVHPDLLLVDLNVPLLYEMMAARQIVKNARLGSVPVVIVTHEDPLDPAAIMELGVRRNEYVTRLSDYQQLECLLDYLLTVRPQAA